MTSAANPDMDNAIHHRVNEFTVVRKESWGGPSNYGFDLAGPGLREAFFEVNVTEEGLVTDWTSDLRTANPGDACLEGIIEGLRELLEEDPTVRRYLEEHGEAALHDVFAQHAERLRDEMVRSFGAAPTAGSD